MNKLESKIKNRDEKIEDLSNKLYKMTEFKLRESARTNKAESNIKARDKEIALLKGLLIDQAMIHAEANVTAEAKVARLSEMLAGAVFAYKEDAE